MLFDLSRRSLRISRHEISFDLIVFHLTSLHVIDLFNQLGQPVLILLKIVLLNHVCVAEGGKQVMFVFWEFMEAVKRLFDERGPDGCMVPPLSALPDACERVRGNALVMPLGYAAWLCCGVVGRRVAAFPDRASACTLTCGC